MIRGYRCIGFPGRDRSTLPWHNGKTECVFKSADLLVCASAAIDRQTIVTYIVSTTAIPPPDGKHGPPDIRMFVMELQAGVGRSRDIISLDVDCVNDVGDVEDCGHSEVNPYRFVTRKTLAR